MDPVTTDFYLIQALLTWILLSVAKHILTGVAQEEREYFLNLGPTNCIVLYKNKFGCLQFLGGGLLNLWNLPSDRSVCCSRWAPQTTPEFILEG